jgi:hypothetical protein
LGGDPKQEAMTANHESDQLALLNAMRPEMKVMRRNIDDMGAEVRGLKETGVRAIFTLNFKLLS